MILKQMEQVLTMVMYNSTKKDNREEILILSTNISDELGLLSSSNCN